MMAIKGEGDKKNAYQVATICTRFCQLNTLAEREINGLVAFHQRFGACSRARGARRGFHALTFRAQCASAVRADRCRIIVMCGAFHRPNETELSRASEPTSDRSHKKRREPKHSRRLQRLVRPVRPHRWATVRDHQRDSGGDPEATLHTSPV